MDMLPPAVQRLFWDTDLSRVSLDSQREFVIERVLNLGTLADWRWLAATYGDKAIRERCEEKGSRARDNLRPESRRLASLLLT